ncbi:protein neprosin-like [Corylus avellana]|uniref:protein neprosin-like n=1 Tax=Corylus avellana TaxID=13451 RepID=UPI00286A1D97|nr:protein neprosin-like [Corylus avellana]
MVKRFIFIFVATTLLALSSGVDVKGEVDQKLKLLNKPAVKSITSEDGDIIDCVDIYKQPAFDHPALRNHTIQMRPSFAFPDESSTTKKESSGSPAPSQTWQNSGSCPDGTVPIRRVRRQELLSAASLEHFGRDGPPTSSAAVNTTTSDHFVYHNGSKIAIFPVADHSTAFLVATGYTFLGAKGDINIWSPRVESSDEYTTAQIWLKNGLGDIETIEAGWMVNPKIFGDAKPRLFGRWTLDAYQTTGCINLICSGFVQTSKKIVLGGAVQPLSQKWGEQFQISISISHDPVSGNWWLAFGDETVGYFPGSILNYMKQSATKVQWGGDVYSKKVKQSSPPHTATAMGSGDFANSLWGVASFIKNLRIIDGYILLRYPQWVSNFSEEPYCYTAYNYKKTPAAEPIFYFGGPGRNPNCP